MNVRAYGPTAWFVDELDDPVAWIASLEALGPDGIIEIVPTEHTVVIVCDRARHESLGRLLPDIRATDRPRSRAAHHVIDVVYDGADLEDVAAALGLGPGELVRRHSAATYTVAFCGFSPGFAYLRGLDRRLELPRRATPRTTVPAGSVAIAAGYSCVYPAPSPGGWHLIGRTDVAVFDVTRPEPALLTPGTTVTFRPVDP